MKYFSLVKSEIPELLVNPLTDYGNYSRYNTGHLAKPIEMHLS